jgi:hypothetical protein
LLENALGADGWIPFPCPDLSSLCFVTLGVDGMCIHSREFKRSNNLNLQKSLKRFDLYHLHSILLKENFNLECLGQLKAWSCSIPCLSYFYCQSFIP